MNLIKLALRIDLLIYALILNVVMFIYIHVQHRRKQYSEKLFQRALLAISLLIILESVSWISGEINNASQIPIHYWSNAIYLGLITLPGCVGLTYLDYKIYSQKKANKRKFYYYMIPTYISVISVIYNLFVPGSLFYIDAQNHYHRGFYIYANAFFMYFFMLVVVILFYKDKKRMSARVFKAVGLYFIAPILGIALQLKAYGTSFSMPSHTLSLFLIFLLLERDEMMRDSLTCLYTRHNFEMRLKDRLKKKQSFSLVVIDLNDFKSVNDTYGHIEGDKVLQVVSEILLNCTNVEDLVCRYGGDEFFMLIEHRYELTYKVIEHIKAELEKHNSYNDKYNIELSYGQLLVREDNTMTMEQLIAEVDHRMYADKLRCKALNASGI
ncbi:GGDEF domain-containing protein [Vallitalea sp.]|jgi:diguanylate cyclase (GGDEF)-like protein|uniref:GGDEF domain-containing protein n=1 Tax=Vallitalea sp. TaxID=1882829 RepID=UPI0025F93D89|nr:GGDEF domain-containing protein [Vallitalea sp.]MCT4687022.1 GGDEF domain-containing protein [Vallitalea sp.]